jgi:arsenite-transporting ATPase
LRHADKTAHGRFITPMMRLEDPDQTKSLIVTLPETTLVQEAARPRGDLARAGITPYAWVVNASLAATDTSHPVLVARAETEAAELARVREGLAQRYAVVRMQADDPVGADWRRALLGRAAELV